jgi:hypothetical protein
MSGSQSDVRRPKLAGSATQLIQRFLEDRGRMNYSIGQQIKVGDQVIADGMAGRVVCDFDNREFLDVYEGWDTPTVEMLGGGALSCGVMIETEEAGLVHYADEHEDIIRAVSAQ